MVRSELAGTQRSCSGGWRTWKTNFGNSACPYAPAARGVSREPSVNGAHGSTDGERSDDSTHCWQWAHDFPNDPNASTSITGTFLASDPKARADVEKPVGIDIGWFLRPRAKATACGASCVGEVSLRARSAEHPALADERDRRTFFFGRTPATATAPFRPAIRARPAQPRRQDHRCRWSLPRLPFTLKGGQAFRLPLLLEFRRGCRRGRTHRGQRRGVRVGRWITGRRVLRGWLLADRVPL